MDCVLDLGRNIRIEAAGMVFLRAESGYRLIRHKFSNDTRYELKVVYVNTRKREHESK